MKVRNSKKRYSASKFIILLLLSGVSMLTSAQYYWVGGSGNWSNYSQHWATSSGGSTFHSSAPSAGDDVIFDANSFSTTGQIVTLDAAQSDCRSIDWSAATNNPGFESAAYTNVLNVYGSITLSADMTCNLTFIEMESNTSGNTITTSGTSLGSTSILRFYGSGSWDLQDVLTVNSIQFLSGTLNTNNNTVNAISSFLPSGSSVKVFNAGSSIINTGQWRMRGTNNTFNMGTSTIVTNSFYGDWENTGPFTYYNVELNNGGLLYDNCSINKLSLGNEGTEWNTIEVESGATINIQELEITSSKRYPLDIHTSTSGTAATFSKSSGSVTVDYVILEDIHAGGGATFTANSSIDNGNTTGWTINAVVALDYYWVANAGNWSDYASHWATSSGGSSFHTSVPSRFDHVHFDAASFTQAGQTVTIDSSFSCATIDFSGAGNSPNLNAGYGKPLTVYGSATFITGMTGSIYNMNCTGNGASTLASGSVLIQNLSIAGSGTWTLQDKLSTANLYIEEASTLNTNGKEVNNAFTFAVYSEEAGLTLGSSTLKTLDFELNNGLFSFDAGSSVIDVRRNFTGRGYPYYKVVLEENATVKYSNSFEFLEILPGTDVKFEAGSTQTINQSLVLSGTAGLPINLSSTSGGTQATLSKAGGSVDGTWLILQDMNATGGASFTASESTDNGNNSGWNITGVVPQDFYWVGGSGNWSDYANHWATTSGGSVFRTREPASVDNVYFDASSFSAEGQIVTIDSDEVSLASMDWTGALHTPRLSGTGKALNIYGSLTLIADMIVTVTDFYFFSTGSETITAGKATFPGTASYMHFNGTGSYTLQDSMTIREIHLNSGTFSTNDNWLHVDFRFYFAGTEQKTLNLGQSTVFARGMEWYGIGDNLQVNGADSKLEISSSLTLTSGGESAVSFSLGNLSIVHNRFTDNTIIYSDVSVDTFLIEAGKNVKIFGNRTVTTKQMIATGSADKKIYLSSVNEGTQCGISQAEGTVNAYYLELKDISASGGATFNAYTSLDLGNVSGWVFFKEAQSIDFPAIGDQSADAAPLTLLATASSGLPVSYEVLSGPATVDGSILTLSGEGGTVQVQASQAGDETYLPAPSVKQSFEVGKLEQTITFADLVDRMSDEAPFTLSATASSGLEVSFEIVSGPASISGNEVTLSGDPGLVEVKATQEGDATYLPAEAVTKSFTVSSASGVQQNTALELQVWPNPAEDRLYLELPDPAQSYSYRIVDMKGTTLAESELKGSSLVLDLPGPGSYLLILTSTEGSYTRHFIVR